MNSQNEGGWQDKCMPLQPDDVMVYRSLTDYVQKKQCRRCLNVKVHSLATLIGTSVG